MIRPITAMQQLAKAAAERGERIKAVAGGYVISDANGNIIDGDQWPLDFEDLQERYGVIL